MGRSLFLAAVFLLALASNAIAVQDQFDGVSDTSGLTLSGNAATASTTDGGVPRLTPASDTKSVSAFSSAAECCSEYDFSTNTLSIPCLKIGGQTYWADLEIVPASGQVLLRLKGFGVGSQCTGGGSICVDCSCPDYAASHPGECGQTGDLTFRITWNDLNDVDLHVVYYNGSDLSEEIYYSHKQGVIGGELDVDANANCSSNVTDRAVENIFYQDPGPGTYTMKVCGYTSCGTGSSSVTAQILVGGSVVWQGQVSVSQWGNNCVDVHTQTVQ